jgi:succinate-acetate transporter protein
MKERKRNSLYWLFKILGIVISCALPIWAVCEKFPLWTEVHGEGRTIGVGMIIVLAVILIVFRRTVFNFIRDRFNLKHAPPLFVWLVLLVLAYVTIYIGNLMRDMITILWMGLVGCGIGTVSTYIAENHFGKEDKDE